MKSGIFNILAGRKIGMYFKFNSRELCLDVCHPKYGVVAKLPYKRILSVKLGSSQSAGAGDAIAGAILGGIVAGSIGAALGASAGGDKQICMLSIEANDGTIYTCEAMRATFDELLRYRYVYADQSTFEPLVKAEGYDALIAIDNTPKPRQPRTRGAKIGIIAFFLIVVGLPTLWLLSVLYDKHMEERRLNQISFARQAEFVEKQKESRKKEDAESLARLEKERDRLIELQKKTTGKEAERIASRLKEIESSIKFDKEYFR